MGKIYLRKSFRMAPYPISLDGRECLFVVRTFCSLAIELDDPFGVDAGWTSSLNLLVG